MSTANLSKNYSLAALLIHSTNQQVTVEAMEKVFTTLKISEFCKKTASLFVLPTSKYVELISTPLGGAAIATTSASSEGKEEAKVPEQDEEEEEDEDLDFGGF